MNLLVTTNCVIVFGLEPSVQLHAKIVLNDDVKKVECLPDAVWLR